MANSTIWDLTAETVMTAAHRLAVQETDTNTRALHATFALLGGLEIETSRDTNANHADFSLVVGQLHLVDMSGALLTSEVVATLPATAQVGERTGIYITGTSTTDGEELSIRNASGDTINDTDYSAADATRLCTVGEQIVFECVVASTDWRVVWDGRIGHKAKLRVSVSADGESAATWVAPTAASSPATLVADWNVGAIAATATTTFKLRRNADVLMVVFGRGKDALTDQSYWGMRITDGTNNNLQQRLGASGTDVNNIYMAASSYDQLTDGTTLTGQFISAAGGIGLVSASWYQVIEILRPL